MPATREATPLPAFAQRADDRRLHRFEVVERMLAEPVRHRVAIKTLGPAAIGDDAGAGDRAVRCADHQRADGVGSEIDAERRMNRTLRARTLRERLRRRTLRHAFSERDLGLELEDVLVGRRARVRPRCRIAAPRHERLAPLPGPRERHLVTVLVSRVLKVDALARQEVRRDDGPRRARRRRRSRGGRGRS